MLYFKKNELAQTYHISEKTVANWMQEAKAGKLDLQLHEANNRTWIANTTRNITLIEQLVESRRKFRNSRGVKIVSPNQDFYDRYSEQQVFDIAANLDIRREIPFQYVYFDGGAEYWGQYAERLATEDAPNFLNSTIAQLRTSQDYIDDLLSHYTRVNMIDVGPGNVLPVKGMLHHLVDQGKMGRYVAVDISQTMLELAERNVRDWFGDTVPFVGYEADINYSRFVGLLTEDVLGEQAESTANIVLALGGTLSNLRSAEGAFKNIHDSMNRNDLLIYNIKLDTESARRYFDFGVGAKAPVLDYKAKLLLDALNIDESYYDTEMGYDPDKRQRYIRVRLKVALTINFEFKKGKRAVSFNKNEAIMLWRYRHQNVRDVIQELDGSDFDVLQTSLTEDKDYLQCIARVKSEHI